MFVWSSAGPKVKIARDLSMIKPPELPIPASTRKLPARLRRKLLKRVGEYKHIIPLQGIIPGIL
jgi:hypothetical protein